MIFVLFRMAPCLFLSFGLAFDTPFTCCVHLDYAANVMISVYHVIFVFLQCIFLACVCVLFFGKIFQHLCPCAWTSLDSNVLGCLCSESVGVATLLTWLVPRPYQLLLYSRS